MTPWQNDGCPVRRKRGKVRCEQTLPGVFLRMLLTILWVFLEISVVSLVPKFPVAIPKPCISPTLIYRQTLLPLKQPAIELTEYSGGIPGNIWILRIGTPPASVIPKPFRRLIFRAFLRFQAFFSVKERSSIFRYEETKYFRDPHYMCKRYTYS